MSINKKRFVFLILFILLSLGVTYFIDTKYNEVAHITPDQEIIVPKFLINPITLASGEKFNLTIQGDYSITPVIEGLKRIRFMAMSPDNRLFVTDMFDLSDNSKGKIYILDGFNQETKKFATTTTYLSNLRNPNSVAFYTDAENTAWLYIALTDRLIRYKYTTGDVKPSDEPEVIATFPDYGLSYKYGGWHLTRTVAFHNDKVYVSVGSSCNSCEEKEFERASILQMNPDGSDIKLYAKGLRNAVGIKWVGNELYATNMGSDHLGQAIPKEMFYKIQAGENYGWPYCYVNEQKEVVADDSQEWTNQYPCSLVPAPQAIFAAHAAPLGLEFFTNDFQDEKLAGSFLVALHGASTPAIGAGYTIAKVDKDNVVTDFITGFLKDGQRYGRPVDILKYTDSSFFFTDDYKGVIYFVSQNSTN